MAVPKLQLDAIRRVLVGRGLAEGEDKTFTGTVDCGLQHGAMPITLKLPQNFPLELPSVYVRRADLPHDIPHHDEDDKLCLFANTGVLVDVSRPDIVLAETLSKARDVLVAGLDKTNQADFITEFAAYWKSKKHVRSICDPFGGSREVILCKIITEEGSYSLLGDDLQGIRTYCAKLGHKTSTEERAFFIKFDTAFIPPSIFAPVKNKTLMSMMEEHGEAGVLDSLYLWLTNRSLPRICVLSLPTDQPDQRTLVAINLERPKGMVESIPKIRHKEGSKQFAQFPENNATRISVDRQDPAFVVPRGGSNVVLTEKLVTLVGAGSLGSRIAEKLSSIGVGKLRTIDPEFFKQENLGRHVLGADSIGINKAKAISLMLDSRFPLQTHEWRDKSLEEVLQREEEFVLHSDLIIISIGDETVQIDFDKKLAKTAKRMHVWVEPLGVGGHVLLKANEGNGCYNCLFEVDEEVGLYNKSGFCRPGQLVQKTHSGCAGVFTPFSALDADRAANEAATIAVNALIGRTTENVLVSWLGTKTTFEEHGFKLSRRGTAFAERQHEIVTDFARDECPYCNKP